MTLGRFLLLQSYLSCVHAKSLQQSPALCDPKDCSPPGASVHGIPQARILEWAPCPPPGDLPGPGIESPSLVSPAQAGRFFTTRVTQEACHMTWFSIVEKCNEKSNTIIAQSDYNQKATYIYLKFTHCNGLQGNCIGNHPERPMVLTQSQIIITFAQRIFISLY